MPLRRYLLGKILFAGIILAFSPQIASAEQIIHTYSSHIELQTDGSANIQEEIVYDFGSEKFHGIYRSIPLSILGLGKTEYSSMDISNISVTDVHGKRLQVKYEKGGNVVVLTIGDADILITGPQLYIIRYTLTNAISANLTSDQLDWDVFGTDWQANIERARAEIVFPKEITPAKISSRCAFISDNGKKTECAGSAIYSTTTVRGFTIRYEATDTPMHTRFMIQASFPKGAIVYKGEALKNGEVANPSKLVQWWKQPFIDFSLVIPFLLFFALLTLRMNTQINSKYETRTTRVNFLLTASALIGISFYVHSMNLALLLSGIIFLLFILLPKKL